MKLFLQVPKFVNMLDLVIFNIHVLLYCKLFDVSDLIFLYSQLCVTYVLQKKTNLQVNIINTNCFIDDRT